MLASVVPGVWLRDQTSILVNAVGHKSHCQTLNEPGQLWQPAVAVLTSVRQEPQQNLLDYAAAQLTSLWELFPIHSAQPKPPDAPGE